MELGTGEGDRYIAAIFTELETAIILHSLLSLEV
jgi:hypothetical protein